MQTERVTVLMTPQKKAALAARAAAQNISIGQYVRQKIEDDDDLTAEQEAELALLVEQVNEAIPRMNAALNEMSTRARAVHEEVDAFLREKGVRR